MKNTKFNGGRGKTAAGRTITEGGDQSVRV